MRLRRIVPLAVAAVVVSTVAASQGQAGGGVAIASCGTTVTTNAYLINDILDCPDHGVTIGADGITIDLKGFTIGGTQAGLRYGINNTGGHDGLTVKNGVVTKFDYGVAASGDGVTVSRLVASGNVNAGIWIDGSSASVKSSSALGNGASGIIVQGGNGANIQSSTASGNALDGIFTNNGSVSVTKSIAFGNGSAGIEVRSDAAKITSSTASANQGEGIHVEGDAPQIKGNRAEGNSFPGGASNGSGLGISAVSFTTPPAGTNIVRGNDGQIECSPVSLC